MNWRSTFCVIFCGFSATSCGHWPPVVNTAQDIQKLSPNERSLRARGLDDKSVLALARLRELKLLDFTGGFGVESAKITDEGLKTLASLGLTNLETLKLGYCQRVSNDGLKYVAQLKTVKWVSLMGCQNIRDEGLKYLNEMNQLGGLDLRGCRGISDSGLEHLARMSSLKNIELGGCTNVTQAGVTNLQRKLPGCLVRKDEKEWGSHESDLQPN